MDNNTELNELATQVATILDERGEFAKKDAYAFIGGVAVLVGVGYIGMRLARNAVDAHRLRKLKKAEK